MIYTVTFNPALDYVAVVDDLKMGATNRSAYEQLSAGGKGINVSMVLNNLGFKTTALGFIAGFTGEEIKRRLEQTGCKSDFIKIDGISRINIKIKSEKETEINARGPVIDEKSVEKLIKKLDTLSENDVLVLAGSIPYSMPENIYSDIMQRLENKGVIIVVDATKNLLMNVLKYHPFLIKPNNHELGEIFGLDLKTKSEVKIYAKKLQQKGAKNVLVSMAGEGAVLISEDGREFESEAPAGKVINSVGAGDSMVAGFIAGYLQHMDYRHAFKMGLAAGSASAFTEFLATKEQIEKVYLQIKEADLI